MSGLTHGARLLGLRGEPILLASRSPRRHELLRMLGVRFETAAPEEPEGWDGEKPPALYVEELARRKASAIETAAGAHVVLAADTVVYLDGEILEKPLDGDHARALLARLSGRWHEVYTGICLRRIADGRTLSDVERSRVKFVPLSPGEIAIYLETGEPWDKAGGYGIQGYGGLLVERIEGCYFNVMGLPLACLRRLAHRLEADDGHA